MFFLTPLVMPSVCFLRCSPCITLVPPLHCSTGGAGERVRCDAMQKAQSSMSRGEGIDGLGERGRLKSPQRAHARVPDAGRTGRGGRCAFSRWREPSLRSPESLSSLPSLQRVRLQGPVHAWMVCTPFRAPTGGALPSPFADLKSARSPMAKQAGASEVSTINWEYKVREASRERGVEVAGRALIRCERESCARSAGRRTRPSCTVREHCLCKASCVGLHSTATSQAPAERWGV